MSNKTKEILDRLKYIVFNEIIDYGEELSLSECKLLLDYITNLQTIEQQYSAVLSENAELENKITNLQEETERQSKAQVILDNQIAKMLKYKQRNEKAIEYIKEKDLTNNANFMDDGVGYLFEDTINILQGKSDE